MKPIDFQYIYRDGRYYDLENERIVDDIPFYIKQIEKYGEPVLELACGTGRITIPIAERGIRIAGLDILDSMLTRAKSKSQAKGVDIEWINADCRDFKLNKKFNLIIFPFNSLMHLHDLESFKACFMHVKDHLTDNGTFIIDVFNPNLNILTRDTDRQYPVIEYPDPEGKGTVVITENNIYDPASQINHIRWYYHIGDGKEKYAVKLNMRILYPQELDTLLHYNGFIIDKKYGNYDETSFESSSPKQLIVCHRGDQ